METLNKKCSPVMQALLDLQAQGVDISVLKYDEQQLSKADEAFNKHQYPDRRITYSRVFNAKVSKAQYSLDSYERVILNTFISFMSVQNLVSISIEVLIELTHFSKKKIIQTLKSLEFQGFIAVHTRGKKNCPTIYAINPALAQAGKPISSSKFKELTTKEAIENYEYLNKNTLAGIKTSTVKTEAFDNYNLVEYDSTKAFTSIMSEVLPTE